ncbi:MAG: hypothetical protein M3Y54_00125 [Bacteroidota bacterium]|nr:hypothetical protein [Bacteroidota bacterium]
MALTTGLGHMLKAAAGAAPSVASATRPSSISKQFSSSPACATVKV